MLIIIVHLAAEDAACILFERCILCLQNRNESVGRIFDFCFKYICKSFGKRVFMLSPDED